MGEYRQMVRELLPELAAATNHSGVKKVLLFPVISDELNLVIMKNNNTGTVQDLTDKMFIKLVPFIREGLLKDINQIETPELEEEAINEIEDILGGKLEMATKDGLVVAGRLQNAFNQELKDHSIAMNYIEEVKPLIKSGVEATMKKLQDRGLSHKGRINDALLVRYVLWRSNSVPANLRKSYGLDEFAKRFQTLIVFLPQLIEEEAEESGDFESGKFKESNTYEDVKLQVESSIHSVVMRELNNMEK